MKLLGFRSKKKWKMTLATLFYGAVVLTLINGIIAPKEEAVIEDEIDNSVDEPSEENISEVLSETSVEFDETNYFKNVIKPLVDETNKEYDSIWKNHWIIAWESTSNKDVTFLKPNMEIVVEKYSELNRKVIDFKTDDASEYYKEYEEYRTNISKAISYRQNAGTAILHAINGQATMDNRAEEAKKSIELSDKYIMLAAVSIVTVQQELDLLDESD